MGKTSTSKLISIFCIAIFVLPLLALLGVVKSLHGLDVEEILWACKNSFAQSILSYIFLAFGAVVGGLGLLMLGRTGISRYLRLLLVIPYFMPPIFIILVGFKLIPHFPRGWLGIALMHAMMNLGMAALVAEKYFRSRFGGDRDVFFAFGISWWSYFRKVVIPQSGPLFRTLLLGFFPLFFASFTVPLIVGGSQGTTLEVMIYEKMRLENDWGAPLMLSVLQIFIQAVFMWMVGKNVLDFREDVNTPMQWLGNRFAKYIIVGIYLVMAATFCWTFLAKSPEWIIQEGALGFLAIVYNSVLLALIVGFSFFIFSCLITFFRPSYFLRFLDLYNSPGTALTAFAFLIIGLWDSWFNQNGLYICFLVLFYAIVYRAFIADQLKALREQIEIAEIFGASNRLIFSQIVFPQIKGGMVVAASVASLWAIGDYAAARILLTSDKYLGLVAGLLLSNYKIDEAGWMCLFIVVVGGFNYLILQGVAQIFFRRKPCL